MHPLDSIFTGLATPVATWQITFSGSNRVVTGDLQFAVTVPQGASVALDNPGFGKLYGMANIDGWSLLPGSIDSPASKVYGIGDVITPTANITLYPHYARAVSARLGNSDAKSITASGTSGDSVGGPPPYVRSVNTHRGSYGLAGTCELKTPNGYRETTVVVQILMRAESTSESGARTDWRHCNASGGFLKELTGPQAQNGSVKDKLLDSAIPVSNGIAKVYVHARISLGTYMNAAHYFHNFVYQ